MGRRGFFLWLLLLLVVVFFPPSLLFLVKPPKRRERTVFRLGSLKGLKSGPRLFFGKIWIFREDGKIWAFLNRCTHLGCALSYDKGYFRCHCHGSIFTKHGKPVYGPAKKRLFFVKVSVSRKGIVTVDTSKLASGPFVLKWGSGNT